MRKFIAPLLVTLAIAVPGTAFAAAAVTPAPKPAGMATAAQSISGTVKSFDLTAKTLTLNDGKVYHLGANIKNPGLKIGDKVTVQWKMNGSTYEATAVTLG